MNKQHSRLAALSAQLKAPKETQNNTPVSVVNLNNNWLFKQAGPDPDPKVPGFLPTARFPTDVYSDLLHHGLIPDPFRGLNEQAVQWVPEKLWVYQTSFRTPDEALTARKIMLVFEGLDTFATVMLNGIKIISTDNMFIKYEVEVRTLLSFDADNLLEITFGNVIEKADEVMQQFPNHKWGTMGGDPKRTAVRKAQFHFGWDWGPRLVTCGPWKPIRLEIFDSKIMDLHSRVAVDERLENADVEVMANVDGGADAMRFELFLEGRLIADQLTKASIGIASAKFQIKNPALWWPFTHGAQPLYTVRASLWFNNSRLDTSNIRFGIRKIELIQQPLIGQDGTSFFLQINNVPLFISGSCWIPADSLTSRITVQKYRDWVSLARSGNQSMIRVWGGGVFEHAALYDACDELGVLVWQDFMFACGNYPTHPSMLESIKIEAEQNVKALRHHPSIVIWAGNNEDYLWVLLGGLEYDPDDKDPESWLKTNFPARYIYEKLLPDVCKALILDTPYHPGSPFGGLTAMDPEVGDLHQWGVWHMAEAPYQEFPNMGGRFVSEFGMQALPSRKTTDKYFLDSDVAEREVEGEVVRWHNKSDGAEDKLKRYLEYNFPEYDLTLNNHIYHTQLLQAEAVGTAYRAWKREWRGTAREYCGGALVWQLNDCWPVTSWAIADCYLRPKMAFWAIKRESAPLTLGMQRTADGRVDAWAVNLTPLPRTLDVVLKMWDVRDGKELVNKVVYKGLTLKPNQSTEVTSLRLPEGLQSTSTAVAAYLLESQSSIMIARHINFHEPLKEVPFQQPKSLSCITCPGDDGSTRIELGAEVPVKGVLVEVMGEAGEGVVFEDNGVDLVPGETLCLRMRGLVEVHQTRLNLTWLGGSQN